MAEPIINTDVNENGFTIFICTDGTRIKTREIKSLIEAPYVLVAKGTDSLIKAAITKWSNLSCVEGDLEEK